MDGFNSVLIQNLSVVNYVQYIIYIYIVLLFISHYIPEKRKFLGILCFRQQRNRRRLRRRSVRRRRITISLSAR